MASARTTLSRRTRLLWFLRAVAVLFPILLVGLANAMCWWTGYGTTAKLVLQSERDTLRRTSYLNPRVDVAYCTEDLRGPEPRGFTLPKPVSTLRIVVVGESTVQGFPFPSELAFPRQMECILQKQWPEKHVEVLNVGIVGISTTPLADLVAQLSAVRADAVVVYAGHNEFYGVGGVATNAHASALTIAVRKFRLGQWLTGRSSPNKEQHSAGMLLERLPAEYSISASSPLIIAATENYEANLQKIITACDTQGTPLLLCTVVSNLHDQSPHASESSAPVHTAILQAIEELAKSDDLAALLTAIDEAILKFPEDAVLQYRRGQCLEKLNRHEEAEVAFTLARDLDPCRYRAPDVIRQAMLRMGANETVKYEVLDLVPVFQAASVYCVPGDDLFLEHVHFNLDGHWLAARAISEKLLTSTFDRPWDRDAVPSVEERNQYLGLVSTDLFSGCYLALSLQNAAPLNMAVDNAKHVRALEDRIAILVKSVPADEMQPFMGLPHKVKIDDAIDGMGRLLLQEGDYQGAATLFELSRRRRPWMPNPFVFGAVCSLMQGNSKEATSLLRQSELTVMPESIPLLQDKDRLQRMISRSVRQGG